ncbi:GDCCVxC domain-containing (seleno)protein [Salinibacter sp.]|uniref:GDCCVxC domain-containing (seleno)protein n=1 Tax=Salinibacter sp. TaxID=2065818 RepID=UPI00234311AC
MPEASSTERTSIIEPTSTVTCPECEEATEVEMPTESCQFFWACPSCETVLQAEEGDCCVFCSFGTVPCPPVQRKDEACC